MYNKDNLGELLAKVDIIPISLAITQAVKESNWGSTNYARQGNAVFGEYTFNIQETIPSQKNSNKEDFVKRKYKNLSESVASYLRNLNTNKDFKDFRDFVDFKHFKIFLHRSFNKFKIFFISAC